MIKNDYMFEGTLEEATESGMSGEIAELVAEMMSAMVASNINKLMIKKIIPGEVFRKKIRLINETEDTISLEILEDEE